MSENLPEISDEEQLRRQYFKDLQRAREAYDRKIYEIEARYNWERQREWERTLRSGFIEIVDNDST